MRSPAQIAASRANGARSRGPTTSQGKRNSSRNSTRHGFCAAGRFLDQNPPAAFVELRAGFMASLHPRDAIESHLVHTMAVAHWRRLQVVQPQTDFLNTAMARLGPDSSDPAIRVTRVLQTTSDTFHRYEVDFDLQFTRAGTISRLSKAECAKKIATQNEPSKVLNLNQRQRKPHTRIPRHPAIIRVLRTTIGPTAAHLHD